MIRLHWRSTALLVCVSAVGLAGFTWPLFVHPNGTENLAHASDAPWLFVVLVPLLLGVVLVGVADGQLDAKAVAVLGVLVACGAALRLPTEGVTGFTGVLFLLIPGGRVFGRGFGFVQGALTLFASALITGGVGPWLPFQMIAAAWVGFLAGCLPAGSGPIGRAAHVGRARSELWLLAAYGFVAGLVYGLVMDMWFWPFGVSAANQLHFVPGAPLVENLRRFWGFHVASALGFDIPRAVGNAVLVLVAGAPVLAALRRAARRAAFDAAVVFEGSAGPEAPESGPLAARPSVDRDEQGRDRVMLDHVDEHLDAEAGTLRHR